MVPSLGVSEEESPVVDSVPVFGIEGDLAEACGFFDDGFVIKSIIRFLVMI